MFAGIRNLYAINSIAVINGGQFIGLMDCRHSPQYPPTKQTRDIHPVLVEWWASVVDGGPTLHQQWVNVSCLLESQLSLPVRFPYNTTRRYNAKAKYFVQHRANIHLMCGMGYADGGDGTINQIQHLYLYNVGPASSTLVLHCTNVIQMFCVYWDWQNAGPN